MDKCSLAVCDDHPIFLEGLVCVLADNNEFEIVEKGCSAEDAVRMSMQHKPDVIFMDLDMPGSVLSAIHMIRQDAPEVKILVLTASVAVELAVQVLEAGAHGYLVKGSSTSEISCAVHAVMRDETYVTQAFASKIIAALQDTSRRKQALQAIKLTAREEQVVQLLLRGKTNREIGDKLQVSEKTVKHYMSVLMQKLHVRNRIEVVLAAQKLEIVKPAREPVETYLQ